MTVKFTAKVVGNIPANRFVVLYGRDEEQTILITLADRSEAVDFVSTRDLVDGEIVNVELNGGLQIWNVEAEVDLEAGRWVSCGNDGKASGRTGETLENVGYTLEPTNAGEVAKVIRRESFEQLWGIEVNQKIDDLESRVSALEGGGA